MGWDGLIDRKGVKGSVYIINTFFFINNYIIYFFYIKSEI